MRRTAQQLVRPSSGATSRSTSVVTTKGASPSSGARVVKPATSHHHQQQQQLTKAVRDSIKTPPSSSSNNNNYGLGDSAVSSAAAASVSSTTTSTSSSSSAQLSLKKKVDDVFKRIQPHTIVQSYEKLLGGLKITPSLVVNSELLTPLAAVPTTLTAGWKAQSKQRESESHHLHHLPAAFDPPSGRFHYARSIQYAPPDPTLSLSTIKTLQVSLMSSLSRWASSPSASMIQICRLPLQFSKKLWHLTAESSNKQLGLALYEIPLGDWQQSSLVVLVWTQTLEVVKFYLQLSIAELLYCAVQRPINIPMDDVDPTYGLHSYIAAITIRTFDSVLWEKEFYGVAFENDNSSASKRGAALSKQAQVKTVELLDDANNGYRDRERYLSTPDAALPVATDAIAYAMDNALIVDLNVWEGSSSACTPVWGLSKPLPMIRKSAHDNDGAGGDDTSRAAATDFSLSVDEKQSLVLLYQDAARGNGITIALEKIGSSVNKKTRVFVKQIELTFSLRFIDATFGTSYAADDGK